MTERRPDGFPEDGFEEIHTVTELAEAIRQSLESEFPRVTVIGEIADFTAHRSGHWYFSLRDSSSRLRVVLFSRHARSVTFAPRDGISVIASGRISHYGGGGATQLVAAGLRPAGRGELELGVRRLLRRLMDEGLTDPARKRPLPAYPETIAVITSPTGAALRDVTRTLARRWPIARLVHLPAGVQGVDAPRSIRAAFERLARIPGIDLVILARGGGAAEDLAAFDDETVARAVASCPVPVVTGIGHEVDTTVCDHVADLRAATPTAAAELAVPDASEVRVSVGDLVRRVRAGATAAAAARLSAVEILLRSAGFRRLDRRLDRERMRCAGAEGRLADWWLRVRGRVARLVDRFPDRATAALREAWHRKRQVWMIASGDLAGTAVPRAVETRREVVKRAVLLIRTIAESKVSFERGRLDGLSRTLRGLGPIEVLERGYAYCTTEDGARIIGSAAGLTPGDRLSVRFHDGRVGCRVDSVGKEDTWQRRRPSKRR